MRNMWKTEGKNEELNIDLFYENLNISILYPKQMKQRKFQNRF